MQSSVVRLFLQDRRRVFLALVLGLGLFGILIRAAWVVANGKLGAGNSEMYFVARSVALTGQLADAYRPGSGPTAHVSPLMPIYGGAVYRLFGLATPIAETVLMVVAIGFIGLSIFGVDKAMRRLSSPAPARLAALAFVCIVPTYFTIELQAFRLWEGGVAAAALALVLSQVLKLDGQDQRPSWAMLGALSLAIGVLALISPPVALACYGCIGLLALRRRGLAALVGLGALSAILLLAVSYPWAARNEAVFGQKVWSRSNFGFNFALGFHDRAISPSDPRKVFVDRLEDVDPYSSDTAYAAMKAAGGELGYSKMWSERTTAWIVENPAEAALIAGRHLVEFYLPPRWQWQIYNDRGRAVVLRQALIWAITILAFAGVAWRLAARDWRWLYVLTALLLPALPYVLAQPVLRYRYVVTTLMTYIAADVAWCLRAID